MISRTMFAGDNNDDISVVITRRIVMAVAADYDVIADRLDEELRTTPRPTRELFAKVVAGVCTRIPSLVKAGKSVGIERLIESGAWADSALALLELELPMWKVRRLVHESGEWFCSLSRQPNLPVELDDSIDVSHEVLALAILRAFIEARRRNNVSPLRAVTVPDLSSMPVGTICCDNFV
jgi:hypothetical protein